MEMKVNSKDAFFKSGGTEKRMFTRKPLFADFDNFQNLVYFFPAE